MELVAIEATTPSWYPVYFVIFCVVAISAIFASLIIGNRETESGRVAAVVLISLPVLFASLLVSGNISEDHISDQAVEQLAARYDGQIVLHSGNEISLTTGGQVTSCERIAKEGSGMTSYKLVYECETG